MTKCGTVTIADGAKHGVWGRNLSRQVVRTNARSCHETSPGQAIQGAGFGVVVCACQSPCRRSKCALRRVRTAACAVSASTVECPRGRSARREMRCTFDSLYIRYRQ
eukprot:6188115-Pleurochrysis_carterae.AAC.1